MNWDEFDEINLAPQHEAERNADREKEFEELDDRQRMSE